MLNSSDLKYLDDNTNKPNETPDNPRLHSWKSLCTVWYIMVAIETSMPTEMDQIVTSTRTKLMVPCRLSMKLPQSSVGIVVIAKCHGPLWNSEWRNILWTKHANYITVVSIRLISYYLYCFCFITSSSSLLHFPCHHHHHYYICHGNYSLLHPSMIYTDWH